MTDHIGDTSEMDVREIAAEARRLAAQASARTANHDDLLTAMNKLTEEVSGLRQYLEENTPTYDEVNAQLTKLRKSQRRIRYALVAGILLTMIGAMWITDYHRTVCHDERDTPQDTASPWCDWVFPFHSHRTEE